MTDRSEASALGVARLIVLGTYWHPEEPVRTPLGELIMRMKDHGDGDAASELTLGLAGLVTGIELDVSESLVVAVPSRPSSQPTVAALVARALTETGGGERRDDILVRRHDGPSVRDIAPSDREARMAVAGFAVVGDVADRDVVLTDDVILTGTTVRVVTSLLVDGGATSVTAVVAARTRQA